MVFLPILPIAISPSKTIDFHHGETSQPQIPHPHPTPLRRQHVLVYSLKLYCFMNFQKEFYTDDGTSFTFASLKNIISLLTL